MYEERKTPYDDGDDKKKKINLLKKSIIGLIITLMAVPAVMCIILIIRVVALQNQVGEMLEIKDRGESTSLLVTDSMPEESGSTEEQSTTPVQESSSDNSNEEIGESSSEEMSTDSPAEETTTVSPLPDGKYAYLTFDDGPSANTMEILDILDRYGVKATFFVNGHTGATMEERYKAIVDRGHAIGIHTYTHKYEVVYGGLDKFEQEIVSLREYIYNITGKDTNLFRFPGGSSNSIVGDIYPYIQWLNDHGYVYWDWNSSSGDASGSPVTAQQIVDNCMIQAKQGYKNLVILMHDTKSKVTTVEALPALIEELQAYGYEIRAIDERSTPAQHRKIQ